MREVEAVGGGRKGMVLRTTQKIDSTRFGALVVEEGEGGGQDTTRVSNLGAWWGWGHLRKGRIHQGKQV